MKYRAWCKVTDDGWTYHVREDGVTFSCERVTASGVEYRSLGESNDDVPEPERSVAELIGAFSLSPESNIWVDAEENADGGFDFEVAQQFDVNDTSHAWIEQVVDLIVPPVVLDTLIEKSTADETAPDWQLEAE